MPNRILKESICTSCEIQGLGRDAEILFYRLLVNCDDYGRMDARPAVVRSRCFPLQLDTVTDQDVKGWLERMVSVGILTLYNAKGKPFLYYRTWERHQQIRAKHSKYPDPDGVQASESNGNHLQSNVPENREYENTRIENTDIKCNQKKTAGNKKPYGHFKNVLLTDDEYKKLQDKFGVELSDHIETLSLGIASKGYRYKDHYATILNWDRREHAKARRGNQPLPRNEDYGDPPA